MIVSPELVLLLVKILLATAAIILLWRVLVRPVPYWGHERPGDLPGDLQEAEHRANNLLQEILNEEEYQQLTRQGYLEVRSPSLPQRVYRVPRHQGVVKVYEKDRLIMYLCVQPVKFLPSGDVVAMHKLSIEGNEDQYLKLANRWYSSPNAIGAGMAVWGGRRRDPPG